jgi:kynureninase
LNFPSDLYIFQGIAGENVTIVPSADGIHGPVPALVKAINKDTALLSLSHTVFKSGYTYDAAQLTAAAHQVGALTLWDLSHSVGAVPIHLNEWGVDLAVGCTYKYVNGGPGAPAFLYVRRDLQEKLVNPISGWFGQKNLFNLDLTYDPTADVTRFLTGTPSILSLAAIEPGIDLLLDAGMSALRAKSVAQTEYFIRYWQEHLQLYGFRLNSPHEAARRGSHVSLAHDDGWRINRALVKQMKVVPDFRQPHTIRFGIAPLYTSFMDVCEALSRLQQVMVERLYEQYDETMPDVT